MASVILAVGNTPAQSSDITLAAGETANIILTDATSPLIDAGVVLHIRAVGTSAPWVIDKLTQDKTSVAVHGPIVFHVRRPGSTEAMFGSERL